MAVAPVSGNSVSWDPSGPTSDQDDYAISAQAGSEYDSKSDTDGDYDSWSPALPAHGAASAQAVPSSDGWAVVGKINPIPVPLSYSGIEDIFYYLMEVEMVQSARKAVTGDGICIGLTFKSNSFIHPKTSRSRGLIEAVVSEVRSHEELRNIAFTSIQINHNTISASHTDNNLIGTLRLP